MRSTTQWTAALVALMMMLGCASPGDEQNYKVLDEETPLFQPESPNRPSLQGPPSPFIAATVSNLKAEVGRPQFTTGAEVGIHTGTLVDDGCS